MSWVKDARPCQGSSGDQPLRPGLFFAFFYYPIKELPTSSGPTKGLMMESVSLTSLAADQLKAARQANSGRASHTLAWRTYSRTSPNRWWPCWRIMTLRARQSRARRHCRSAGTCAPDRRRRRLGRQVWPLRGHPTGTPSLQAVDDSVVILTALKSPARCFPLIVLATSWSRDDRPAGAHRQRADGRGRRRSAGGRRHRGRGLGDDRHGQHWESGIVGRRVAACDGSVRDRLGGLGHA